MSEFVQENYTIPPLLIALDTVSPDDAIRTIDSINPLPSELVGVKVPRWFDQHVGLRQHCRDSGRFTVLDLQLDDGVDAMALNTQSILSAVGSAGRLLLPNAITMSPAKETVRAQWPDVKKRIIDFAHDQELPVAVISHIDQTRMNSHDPLLHETEIQSSLHDKRLAFDAYEVHANTILSNIFPAKDGEIITQSMILASRLGAGEHDDAQIINRIARTFRRGACAIYLGRSIMTRPFGARLAFIGQVLEAHQDARELSSEDFKKKHPEPKVVPPKIADSYKVPSRAELEAHFASRG